VSRYLLVAAKALWEGTPGIGTSLACPVTEGSILPEKISWVTVSLNFLCYVYAIELFKTSANTRKTFPTIAVFVRKSMGKKIIRKNK
jgi:hypothetical protein